MKNQNQTRPAVWVQCPECQMTIHRPSMALHLKGNLCWGDSVPILNEETKAIWSYWKQKKQRHDGYIRKGSSVKFLLSATDMVQLLNDAGITAKDIGRASHQYALARHNDTGDYEMGNCRFITVKENIGERKPQSLTSKVLHQPQSRTTHTPNGTYNSLNEAARAYGVGHKTIAYRINSTTEKMKEYYYA